MEPSPTARQAAWPGVVALPDTTLPVGIRQPGRVLEMKRWRDAAGEQLLVVSRPAPKVEYRPGDRSAEGDILKEGDIRLYASTAWLYIRQYRRVGEAWQEVWRLQDVLDKCFLDRWIGTLPGSTSVTDLDKDGQTETTIVYMITCRSDYSASAMKLVMREGPVKYALRGFSLLNVDADQYRSKTEVPICCNDTVNQDADAGKYALSWFGLMPGHEGMYFNEKEFAAAPASFLQFARQEWRYWRVREQFNQL
ncbi:hypothetical protein FY528_04290 [Hymenobacter lutimineralis]|uniref:Uncharacterized protein n=1 Tax=Hymenobacter lutimineralis TaxID=2606448 RepID=A0A5D6VBF9_9BACT|nr:hypothetical protein [Hymenobacter lutimineralis]TYZ12522.1 hypothetical protein FY528_04290 [Hymenobacter lutimineralis]